MKTFRRLPRWVRALSVFLIAYFAVDVITFAGMLVFHYWWSSQDPMILAVRGPRVRADLHQTVLHIHRWVLGISAILYGFRRSSHNHPARMPGYKQWLKSTPWHAPMPLPLGRPTFQWWDGLVVVLAAGLNYWNAGLPWEVLIFSGCTAYALGTLGMLVGTGRKHEAYSVALGLSLILWVVPNVTVMLLLAISMTAIAHEGLRGSLYGFPWELTTAAVPEEPWPMPIYDNVNPRVPPRKAAFTAVLLASWAGGLVHFFGLRPSTVAFFSAIICLLACLIRLSIYCGSYSPPLTLSARIRHLRLILPGYDQALVVPLGAALLGVALPAALYQNHSPAPAIAAASIGATALLLFTGGPTLRVWQLTGYHCYASAGIKRPAMES
jgi:hypothetical protein